MQLRGNQQHPPVLSFHKSNYGKTKIEQMAHGNTRETATPCEVKYLSNDGVTPNNVNDTFDKVTKTINWAKVNDATTKLADNDPAQHTGILVNKQANVDCNDALVDVLAAPCVSNENNPVLEHVIDWFTRRTYEAFNNKTGFGIATNKHADDDPLQSTLKLENNDPVCVVVVNAKPVKVNVKTNTPADNEPIRQHQNLPTQQRTST